ncbi:hypothetical protein K2O51_31525 (plasmid) [Cupriavidus pinatubonensis]|uniref:hypothetical protein n=1 Tax=Cupriavidus pinatubonensis TaxID=248026 RepID=UPI001C73B1A2|nr:hypothetical protein [Cupriavidus pinatubonensis]QYY33562.1 hypothetical protein K2O51_31525 [Cupriavidus pinatubonensis]
MEFLKLLYVFVTHNPFIAIPAAIGILYAILVSSGAIDCETRHRVAANPASVSCTD